jgi:hypothetical protein
VRECGVTLVAQQRVAASWYIDYGSRLDEETFRPGDCGWSVDKSCSSELRVVRVAVAVWAVASPTFACVLGKHENNSRIATASATVEITRIREGWWDPFMIFM